MASCRKCGTDEVDLICEGHRWISVNEKMPKEDYGRSIYDVMETTPSILIWSNNYPYTGWYFAETFFHELEPGYIVELEDATHWQYITPPKEDVS